MPTVTRRYEVTLSNLFADRLSTMTDSELESAWQLWVATMGDATLNEESFRAAELNEKAIRAEMARRSERFFKPSTTDEQLLVLMGERIYVSVASM